MDRRETQKASGIRVKSELKIGKVKRECNQYITIQKSSRSVGKLECRHLIWTPHPLPTSPTSPTLSAFEGGKKGMTFR